MYKRVDLDNNWFITFFEEEPNLFHIHRDGFEIKSWGANKNTKGWICRMCDKEVPINVSIIADLLFCKSYSSYVGIFNEQRK